MAGEQDPRAPGLPEEKGTFGGQRFVEKDPEMLTQRPESFPGCLTRVPWLLLLLLSSMGLCFVLLVTTLVQVSRVPGYPQEKFQDHQGNSSLVAAADQQMHPGLEQIRQQLAWINASLAGLCRPCPWSWEAFQESCYFFSRTLGSWEDSVSSCQAMGAHLVIINNTAEQRFLRYWDIRKSQRTWIGLSDHNNEGSWYWVDNTPLRLSFWKEGEPNDSGNEDCVELVAEDWNDSKCAAQNFWVCERPSAPCPGA
ncbi:CD209 antigen-like protein E isoform X2 [Sciurus carolinensis]|uniref:CD209 antigen-like protein E isoform X2 n=1 Tax=Sciurus carolinensis TaxID=30640 RepID=UPI001FB48A07|nr:CD209 antigen-like protein E isoform X2 [Sciurus carolinensis]